MSGVSERSSERITASANLSASVTGEPSLLRVTVQSPRYTSRMTQPARFAI